MAAWVRGSSRENPARAGNSTSDSLSAFCADNYPGALKVFEDLRGQGADFKSYNVLITGFLRAGKSCEAACLVEEDSADSVEGERGGADEEIKDKDKAAAG